MKKIKILRFIPLLLLLLGLAACEKYVTSVDPLIDRVEDDVLTREDQVPFLITGIKDEVADCVDDLFIAADGLSDQLIFTRQVRNATYPTYEQLDLGDILTDNNSIDAFYFQLHRFRKYADTLIARVDKITFANAANKNTAMYNAYLYGGLARYFSAAYMGLNPTEFGDAINVSPFIPSATLYNLAVDRWKQALTFATDAQKRVLNSLIARAYLMKGDYTNAATYAQSGMVSGDAAFEAKYSTLWDNNYRVQAGQLRSQFVLSQRMLDYVTADPKEANRIAFMPAVKAASSYPQYYYQYKYKLDPNTGLVSSIPFMTWQENSLMLAELILRGNANGDALALVNSVRASHGIDPLATITLSTAGSPNIVTERDKELCFQGARLLDERRFNIFHLGAGKWQCLPITDDERNENPNF